MRWAALLAVTLGSAGATSAGAETRTPDLTTALSLHNAAFAPRPAPVTAVQSFQVRLNTPHATGAVDTVRIKVAEPVRLLVLLPYAERNAFDVTVVRSWPKAVSFGSDSLDVDIAPHAGLGVSSRGGQAEGGATLTISPKTRGQAAMERLRDIGVRDGAVYGDTGRWYLFAAASGQAVGLNMLHGENGWDRAGWSTDSTGALVGDAQIGVGWRKGDGQASFGVIHREVKGNHMIWAQDTRDDTVAAFTFSIRPGR